MHEDEKRGDDRLPVIWDGQLTTEDDQSFMCQVRDISHAGALISTDAPVKIGDELVLEVPELGHFAGKIRWSGDRSLGLALMAGPDLALKKFAEKAGASISTNPETPEI